MIPILYKSDEVDFYNNGLGQLTDIYSVDVQEQRNGLFTLTASYPVSGKRYKDIEVGRIIYAKPNPEDGAQAFRIVKTDLDISGYAISIEADHITYDLTHNLVKEVHLQGDGQNAMTHLQNATVTPHLFRFVSDLQHEGDSRLQYVNPMEAIAGTEGSILQIWGGELKRDNRTVSMLSRRGRNNFTTFRLGKNINGLKYTVDMSNVVTRIIPTVTKSDATDNDKAYFVVGDTVDSKNIGKYSNVYIQHVDMGDKVTINEGETDEQVKAKINKQAKNWFTQSANSGIDLPTVTVEIDVTSLQDSADYQEAFKNLEAVELCDTVTVYVPEFGVNVQAVVTEFHYDPMAERVTNIVVGTSKVSFTDANQNALAELQNTINQIRQDATTAIVSSNGKNTNYYGTSEPKHPKEGDLWFKQVGDETYLMIFKDGRWQEWVSTKTQEEIAKQVDDAIKEANKYADELNDKQAKAVQEFQDSVNKELGEAEKQRTALDGKIDAIDAQTEQKLLDAGKDRKRIEDKASQMVTDAESRANKLIGDNKDKITAVQQDIDGITEVVNDPKAGLQAIRQLASDGQTIAVSARDKADKAQKDATTAVTTAQGTVTTVNSVKGDVSNLQSKQTQTAKQLTTEIADRKSGDNLTETHMKDLISQKITSVTQGYTSLNQQTEQSFKTQIKNVVDQMNNLGQVNQLTNTEFNPDLEGWESTSTDGKHDPYLSAMNTSVKAVTVGFNTANVTSDESYFAQFSQKIILGNSIGGNSMGYISISWQSALNAMASGMYAHLWVKFHDKKGNPVFNSTGANPMYDWAKAGQTGWPLYKAEKIEIPKEANDMVVSFETREGVTAYLAKPMVVFGDTIGSYTSGTYNNNNLVESTRVQLNNLIKDQIKNVKDNITTTKTQTDRQITNEVNDRKTGDSTVESNLKDLISQKVTSLEKGYQSYFNQKADGILAGVSQPNRLFNTQFTPDLAGWNVTNNGANGKNYNFYRSYVVDGETTVGINVPSDAGSDSSKYYAYFEQDVAVPGNNDNTVFSLTWDVRTVKMDNYASLWLIFKDANHNTINQDLNVLKYWSGNNVDGKWYTKKAENIKVPKEAKYVRVSFQTREGMNAYLKRPMFVFRSIAMDYMPGSYSGMNTSTVMGLLKDNWYIGIADNAGRLISGINGDKSGTVIQGKKLIVNSDTTFTGSNFMNGAVIKDASISQAKIGNLRVGSAQIINVDVAKISGNIANFITGNIKTLNSHVLYGDTGHLNTTDTGRVINKQDNHLQLASKGMYNSANNRAQVELLSHTNDIDANMRGSFNYYSDVSKGHGLGIRMVQNQILAIDEDGGSKMLYLSPYAGGQVRVVSRDKKAYYDICASNFKVSSQRKFKSNITDLDDGALDIVNSTKIHRYTKNDTAEIGVIADEAPQELLSDDGKFINIYDYTSVLYKAVQELSQQVKELQDAREPLQ